MPDETIETVDWASRIKALIRSTPGAPEQSKLDGETALLGALGTMVQGIVETELSQTIGARDHVEAYDGDDTDTLFLLHVPIVSVSSVTIDGVAVTVDDGTSAPTYPPAPIVLNSSRNALVRTDGDLFTEGIRNVTVAYAAGLSVTENDGLIEALALWAATIYRTKDKYHISSSTVAGMTNTFRDEIPTPVKRVLDSYRRTFVPRC